MKPKYKFNDNDVKTQRYMALQYDRIQNHRTWLEKKHGVDVSMHAATEHWTTFNEAYFCKEWAELYAEHKHEFKILCDRECGKGYCNGVGNCNISDELVHHIEYGLEKLIDTEQKQKLIEGID